ncbi:Helix-turn-helix protein [uncultured Mycobacterium sp.]|uniref:Helix-turn-helix protein n=1 Tax=uncultured Mycobacterium sp. TaxID=171292 RepID=A0A1Y5PG57_9MYCO|nr:Helix-turn-helix protein [uncultured Mycobacterium sp.]
MLHLLCAEDTPKMVGCQEQPAAGIRVNINHSEISTSHFPATNEQSGEVERLDMSGLSAMLRARRGKLSLRQAASDAGVSFSTFSRVEAGAHPDLTSFMLLCAWLGVAPSQFFAPVVSRERGPLEEAITHLRSDPRLEPEAAKQITGVLRDMYAVLAKTEVAQPVVACHLRAASVLRPGVPERLNTLLTEMHDRLAERIDAGEL